MATDTALRMSAFVDCGSSTVVMRVPFKLAIDMLVGCPMSSDKADLITKVQRAARRSKKLSTLLEQAELEGEKCMAT